MKQEISGKRVSFMSQFDMEERCRLFQKGDTITKGGIRKESNAVAA